MKNHTAFLGAILCAALAIALLWVGRASIATNTVLLAAVSFWMLMALLLGIRTDTTSAIETIVRVFPGLCAVLKPTLPPDPAKPEPPAAPPRGAS